MKRRGSLGSVRAVHGKEAKHALYMADIHMKLAQEAPDCEKRAFHARNAAILFGEAVAHLKALPDSAMLQFRAAYYRVDDPLRAFFSGVCRTSKK